MIPGEEHEGHRHLEDAEHLEFGCGFADGTIATIETDQEQQAQLEKAMADGSIASGAATINLSEAGATVAGSSVSFPRGLNIAGSAKGKSKSKSKSNQGAGAEATSRHRKLAQLVGNKYTLVVKGRFLDYPFTAKSKEQIGDDVFGTLGDPVNLKSQLEACSFGQLVTVPGPDPTWSSGAYPALKCEGPCIGMTDGVLELDMGVNMAGMTKSDIYNLFVSKTVEALGAEVTGLPGPFDHVIFARETCLTDCGWAAYAYINSWGQMFQGGYISQTGVQTHEMGHNLNLAHSGSQGISWSGGSVGSGGYTDHTCSMGNPLYSDDVGKMCFNPAKNYQIDGWYNDAKLTLDPAGKNGPASLPWEGDVVGVGEYNLRTDQPVTIKIETGTPQDIFVGFNRAAGPNEQNDLADDQVNVIQVDGNDGLGYSQSQLISLLDGVSYSEYTVSGLVDYADLKIKVNSINTATTPGTANLRIGFDQCVDDTACQDLAGGCFTSTCQAQGSVGANVLGCVNTPKSNCCGNDICESGESSTSCPADCIDGPNTVQPDDCSGCWIRDGAMFDVEAKPDADITITGVEYKAYTSSGNVRLYKRVGGRAGYNSGTNLLSNGWEYVTAAAACGSWTYCSINNVSIDVPRGTRVGLLVAYDNGGDVLYYNNNYGPTSDEFITVHEGSAVNLDVATETASSFHNALMFSGKVTYTADLTPPPPACLIDADCDDNDISNGLETCTLGECVPGVPPTNAPTPPPSPSPTPSPTTGPPTPLPTNFPTNPPTTGSPTSSPTTGSPTPSPSKFPTKAPTPAPTNFPTNPPTPAPSQSPVSTIVKYVCQKNEPADTCVAGEPVLGSECVNAAGQTNGSVSCGNVNRGDKCWLADCPDTSGPTPPTAPTAPTPTPPTPTPPPPTSGCTASGAECIEKNCSDCCSQSGGGKPKVCN
jgi:hypothetical protein